VEQADGHGLGPEPRRPPRDAARLAPRERRLGAAVGEDALAHAEPQAAGDERCGAARLERVQQRARLTRDLQHVLEATVEP
jgi:hypothetical protein